MTTPPQATRDSDVVCIGAGIMSATLAMLLKMLRPETTIAIYERLDQAGAESSDAWNNAGTGHSAFCELNYTPERQDGSVDISKAIKIAESFEVSRQFWSYLVQQGVIPEPGKFITPIPHMSFVWGDANVQFLRRRYEALQSSPLFQGMQFTTDPQQIATWAPLIMNGRTAGEPVAATRMAIGTDVNFGTLTRSMCAFLAMQPGVRLHFNYDVFDLYQDADRRWRINLSERTTKAESEARAGFVFIGAGGGSLPLLLKSDIPEGKSFGGFPVSGQWLVCRNPDLIKQQHAKVYGKAAVGSPPMSVPHLDTRFIDGKQALFFGPYAGFSTRFLKHGSLLDLPLSVRAANILPMMAAGLDNVALTRYLIEQVLQSPEDRLAALREYFPAARQEDWELKIAGQRVQVIKKDEEQGGILEFGTEVVSAADGSLAALLGASPGASTAVSIMLSLLDHCFPDLIGSPATRETLKRMIPSYGQSLHDHPDLCREIRAYTSATLSL